MSRVQVGPQWVRSWDTATPVARSSAELETLLRRYGAHGYTVSNDYMGGTLVVGFTLPATWQVKTDQTVDVRLAVSYGETRRRLGRMPQFVSKSRGKGESWALEQAERVAWRHLLLWAEASLAAAAAGIQTVEESFFAHTVVPSSGARVIDHVNEQRLLRGAST